MSIFCIAKSSLFVNRAPFGVPVEPDVKHTQTGRSKFFSSSFGWKESTRNPFSNFSLLSASSIISTEASVGIPSNSSEVAITRSGSTIPQIDSLSGALRRGLIPAVITPIFDAAV